jgi:hypothetical protein
VTVHNAPDAAQQRYLTVRTWSFDDPVRPGAVDAPVQLTAY